MTYSPIIPNGVQSPKDQVVAVQTNFAQFAAIFASTSGGVNYNHTALNDTNQGDHESVILTNQTADPGVTTALDVLYSKNASSKAGIQPQLFVQIPKFLPNQNNSDNVPNTPMQLTYNSVNTSGPIYQSFLAGGYLLYFGMVSSIGSPIILSPAPTKLLIAIADGNNVLGVNQVPFNVCTSINTTTNDRFTIFSDNATGSFTYTWMAIGTV